MASVFSRGSSGTNRMAPAFRTPREAVTMTRRHVSVDLAAAAALAGDAGEEEDEEEAAAAAGEERGGPWRAMVTTGWSGCAEMAATGQRVTTGAA